MKPIIQQDNIRFILPRDRELQFPAMALVQKFINNYDEKMVANDVSSGRVKYEGNFWLDIDQADWQFWQDAGLELKQQPIVNGTGHPDMTIDMSDERLLKFKDSGKHACQVCGVLGGEECPPLPTIKKVNASTNGSIGILEQATYPIATVYVKDLLKIESNELMLVLGYAGWETYLACAMGLPVIEVLPEGRHVNWLSKWVNKGYRQVLSDERTLEQIMAAIESIREMMFAMVKVEV